MTSLFDQNIVTGRKIIDFHTHPYRKRGEFMGMYGEHFYLPPEQMPEDLASAGEYGMVVSYHTMPEWAPQMEKMVSRNPGVTFVAAHPGQKDDYLRHVGRMNKYPNLYLDISGTGLFRYGLLASCAQTVGSKRILFGTDYPICNPRMYVQAVLGEHIPEEDKENILWRNAKRILGI